jgi:hypothetical protein
MTIVILDAHDAIELTSILEFFAGWLRADIDYARSRLLLDGDYSVDDLHTDTARLIKVLKAT